ncbi:copper resistance protein CopC [Nitrosomonas sp. HPC101]|uniref:copper resistance CopC family protein n=1 Tax=Nitrosomonas sp. HPC101 TaxID=1658667 RepID=UPI00136C2579|nr:copper resistance CopC family protein [Nitrosomonas sp. HPC101]MXS86102.1 copper resistance protein CopC [Nitrosomonas sp. HPC101]
MIKNNYFKFITLKLAAMVKISTVILGFGLVILMLHPDTVFAHAELVKAEPARRAALTTPPKQIRLWFNEEIEADYASISLLDADNKVLTEEKPMAYPDDPKSVYLDLPELVGGRYTVKFRVLSVDGHVLDSEYKFTVRENKTAE